MISKKDCLRQVREVIDGVLSTVDEDGNPQSRIIDIMLIDDETVYFLTARGKDVYKEIIAHPQVSYLNLKDNKSIRITGMAKKLDNQKEWIDKMFEENRYMNNVYPGDARYILEPFCIGKGEIEVFDLTQKPIYREKFSIGDWKTKEKGYRISEECIECGICKDLCPQQVISEGTPFEIAQNHCLHCGLCYENCPSEAIEKIHP